MNDGIVIISGQFDYVECMQLACVTSESFLISGFLAEKTAVTLRKISNELLSSLGSSIIINQPLVAALLYYFYSENVVGMFLAKFILNLV